MDTIKPSSHPEVPSSFPPPTTQQHMPSSMLVPDSLTTTPVPLGHANGSSSSNLLKTGTNGVPESVSCFAQLTQTELNNPVLSHRAQPIRLPKSRFKSPRLSPKPLDDLPLPVMVRLMTRKTPMVRKMMRTLRLTVDTPGQEDVYVMILSVLQPVLSWLMLPTKGYHNLAIGRHLGRGRRAINLCRRRTVCLRGRRGYGGRG